MPFLTDSSIVNSAVEMQESSQGDLVFHLA